MPVRVPPVPIPPTTASTWPPVSAQISSAVVAAWMAGLAGLSNCRGIQASGREATTSSARAMAPAMPFLAGVSSSSAPINRIILRRSTLAPSGITTTSRYPFAAATNASAMPVLPEVGSTSVDRPGAIRPARSASSTMARPIRSFTEPSGLKNSSFRATRPASPPDAASRGRRTSGVPPMVSSTVP